MEVSKMIFPKFFDVVLWVIGYRFFLNTVWDNLQDEFTINNSHITNAGNFFSRSDYVDKY